MALKPEVSLGLAAAVAVGVYSVFQVEVPDLATVKAASPNQPHIKSSINSAGWTAAGIVAGISLLAKDPTIFVVGGAVAAALTWKYKHGNMSHPVTGEVVPPAPVNADNTQE